jgi:hypothetical protein
MDTTNEQQHLDQHLNPDDTNSTNAATSTVTAPRLSRAKQKSLPNIDLDNAPLVDRTISKPSTSTRVTRRSARTSLSGVPGDIDQHNTDTKGKKKVDIEEEEQVARSKR